MQQLHFCGSDLTYKNISYRKPQNSYGQKNICNVIFNKLLLTKDAKIQKKSF